MEIKQDHVPNLTETRPPNAQHEKRTLATGAQTKALNAAHVIVSALQTKTPPGSGPY